MRISDTEVQKILNGSAVVNDIVELDESREKREADKPLVRLITRQVIDMPDREDMVAELKARVDAGEYNPSGDDIADAMIRRSIADRVR
ncbi:MAG: flagellar biosynthesis anti-sigma factor FlgM [Fimbriimonadaceae bacterium]